MKLSCGDFKSVVQHLIIIVASAFGNLLIVRQNNVRTNEMDKYYIVTKCYCPIRCNVRVPAVYVAYLVLQPCLQYEFGNRRLAHYNRMHITNRHAPMNHLWARYNYTRLTVTHYRHTNCFRFSLWLWVYENDFGAVLCCLYEFTQHMHGDDRENKNKPPMWVNDRLVPRRVQLKYYLSAASHSWINSQFSYPSLK